MTAIRITAEKAAAVLQGAADATPGKRVKGITPTANGRMHHDSYAMHAIQAVLDDADEIAWQEGPFGYDLAVLCNGDVTHFNVPMPSATDGHELLLKHGPYMLTIIEDASLDDGYTAEMRERMKAAHADVQAFLDVFWTRS